ncbi:MAG: NAD-dependent epimerase/dehydratase family protein [Dehalococcoidales bacterium]
MRKYFITGGSGFIGSHIVKRLLSEGSSVTVYDNLSTGNKKLIERYLSDSNFRFIEADILDIAKLNQFMPGHDTVWHLAANTDIIKGNTNTDWDLKNCTIGTYCILESMRNLNIKNLIFASSATVYGDVPPQKLVETDGPLLPISLYGAGKLAGEGLVSAYCHLFDIRACIFRFGNVVGANMWHGVILDFIKKLQTNPHELEILGDGKQEKNFFTVEDCIQGMLTVFEKSTQNCDVFNLGADTCTTVTKIADIVCNEMGLKNVTYKYTGGSRGWRGDAPYVRFNIDKVKNLGWMPRYTSDEAVRIAARQLLGKE